MPWEGSRLVCRGWVVAVVCVQSLALELLHAVGVAKKIGGKWYLSYSYYNFQKKEQVPEGGGGGQIIVSSLNQVNHHSSFNSI